MKTKYIFLCCLLFTFNAVTAQKVITGAEQMDHLLPILKGKRVALVVNQTSRVGETHLLDTLLAAHIQIKKVFAPEHGFRGDADAGETIKNGKDTRTGVPILSLYGKNKKPAAAQLQDIDLIVFDIQDVGARFYTYISTMQYIMEACAENRKQLVITDRPNPCDYVDGPVRQKNQKSFVGMHPIPILHGCTVGELAQMINGEGWLSNGKKCALTVIPVEGWKHGQPYSLPVKPSPNLPNDQAIALYPSLCPFEGTAISVGRGTLYPFQVIGSPDIRISSFSFRPEALEGFDKNPMYKNQYFVGYFYNLTRSISDSLYLYISHPQQTCTKMAIKKSNEGGARAYWQVGIENIDVFLLRLPSHLSLVWSCFLSNFCHRISSDFGLFIWHEVAMFDIFSNRI